MVYGEFSFVELSIFVYLNWSGSRLFRENFLAISSQRICNFGVRPLRSESTPYRRPRVEDGVRGLKPEGDRSPAACRDLYPMGLARPPRCERQPRARKKRVNGGF